MTLKKGDLITVNSGTVHGKLPGLDPRAVIWRTAVPKMSLLDTLLISQ